MSLPTMTRAEIWRAGRHRISRIFVAVMLVTVTGLMIFQAATHNQDVEGALRQAEIERDRVQSSELMAERETELPVSAFYSEPRYLWAFNARHDVQATAIVATVLAFMRGVILSGSGWSTGTNRHVFTWEPRRASLLSTRAAAVAGMASLTYLVAAAITMASTVAIAATRGSFVSVSSELVLSNLGAALRGTVTVALLAIVGSAFADLIRSAVIPLVTMTGYLILVEPAVAAAFPNASNRMITSLILEWIRGRILEGPSIAIDCGFEVCPGALQYATAPGPGIGLGLLGAVLLATMRLTTERRDIAT